MDFIPTPEDHELTRQVIEDWLRVVDATDPQERAALLNQQMAAAAAYPRLVDHDDEGWHLHYRDTNQGMPHVFRAIFSVGTALHLTTRGMHRLGRCAAGEEPGRYLHARWSWTSPATAGNAIARCAAPTARPSGGTAPAPAQPRETAGNPNARRRTSSPAYGFSSPSVSPGASRLGFSGSLGTCGIMPVVGGGGVSTEARSRSDEYCRNDRCAS